MRNLIPQPVFCAPGQGEFLVQPESVIVVTGDAGALDGVAQALAEMLHEVTGNRPPIHATATRHAAITLRLDPDAAAAARLGSEGYRLTITPDSVEITAAAAAGHFYALQTLRQLLPPPGCATNGAIALAAGEIVDYPRFAWRGAMLDVSRHFFGVPAVKRYLDLLALYKLNRLHLHLADDQGWRIEIKSWPRLTEIGGSSAVNGEGGGFYTQEEYGELVAYAAERFITIVPEIDLPGHTNAALAAYAELNCDGVARPLYTGIAVGFSSLCIDKEITYQFLDDVLGELAALTPGPYLHIGGDEAHSTPKADFIRFMDRVQPLVAKHGKQIVGWEELGQATLLPQTLVQQWNADPARVAPTLQAVAQGAKVIMSPANRVYIDMQYDEQTPLGLHWAGYVELLDAYDWDPGNYLAGVTEADVIGVEAPMWSETLRTIDEVEFMAFPRLPAIAEVGWSPQSARRWEELRSRLVAHAALWTAHGIQFYRSPQVDWS